MNIYRVQHTVCEQGEHYPDLVKGRKAAEKAAAVQFPVVLQRVVVMPDPKGICAMLDRRPDWYVERVELLRVWDQDSPSGRDPLPDDKKRWPG